MRVAQVWRYPVKSMQDGSLGSMDLGGGRVPSDLERSGAGGETVRNLRATPNVDARVRATGGIDAA